MQKYLLTYVAITTIGFQPALKLLSYALRAAPQVVHTERSQGIFNLVFPSRTRSSLPPMTIDHRIKTSSPSERHGQASGTACH